MRIFDHPVRRAFVQLTAAVAIAALLAACGGSSKPETSKSGSSRQDQIRSTDSAVAFKGCGSSCQGELSGAKYSIVMPAKWNGTLLLYSHGYRFAQPGPPSFAAIETDAQVTSTDSDGSGSDALSKNLLSRGYALAGSSYKSNGWAVADGVQAGEDLYTKFSALVAKPKRTYVWGDSLGGLITEILGEKDAAWVDGAAPMCGAVAGPNYNFDLGLDVAYAVKTLIYPDLKLTGYTSGDEATTNWKNAAAAVTKAAADVSGGGTAKVLMAAAIANAPTQTATYDGSGLESGVKARVESILTALALGTTGRYELEQRVGGNPSGNVGVDYSKRISSTDAGLIGLAGGNVADLTAQLAAGARVTPDADARTRFEKLGDTTGDVVVPTVTLHTEADPLVLVANESVLAQRAEKAKKSAELAQFYIKAPATYSEADQAPYGAGHCNFSIQQREGLITVLDGWVRGGARPNAAAVSGSFGAGFDASYAPKPWPAAKSN
ncbi:MAG: hypothetical protein JWM76_73 [Pseudonocardiales bacterium]|nr:hypothetical protein [Pseudonocardiales bacterium]